MQFPNCFSILHISPFAVSSFISFSLPTTLQCIPGNTIKQTVCEIPKARASQILKLQWHLNDDALIFYPYYKQLYDNCIKIIRHIGLHGLRHCKKP
jgi:hypothetical protein